MEIVLPNDVREDVASLLNDPQSLKLKKPFTRGIKSPDMKAPRLCNDIIGYNDSEIAELPNLRMYVIPQSQYMAELDPQSHKILYDDNIPSITMKLNNGSYATIEYERMAVSYQRNILDKQVQHLCGNKMEFTLMNTRPDAKDADNYTTYKQYWDLRNMDGWRTKMVTAQKSVGDAGLLFYHDRKGRIKCRLLSYLDGYVLCPHNDDNGERILESVYYQKDGVEYIDSYDDKYFYRYRNNGDIMEVTDADGNKTQTTWVMEEPKAHGFSEIPLITHRGKVAWDNVQSEIEVYEVIYNIFLVIQKRHGWGILYVKGKFSDKGQKIAGAIVLNDTSLDGNGSAEFKTPPSPQNMIDTLGLMEETIQKGSSTTFLLPKDVKSTGDISAQAIMLTQSLDIENALQGVAEWQNVADKMARLFKEGLAKELVNNGKNPTAVTDFAGLMIRASFRVWRPQSETEYNNMVIALKSANILSKQTSVEKCTMSSPDELMRLDAEKKERVDDAVEKLKLTTEITGGNSATQLEEEKPSYQQARQ